MNSLAYRNQKKTREPHEKGKEGFLSFLFYVFPGAISIVQVQALDVFMYTQSAIGSNLGLLLGWILFQGIMGIIYAKISDGDKRKLVLVLVQMLGVPICMVLYFFGHSKLIPMMLVALFNPLSVAKATLLDNFPKRSSLRILALAYFLQYLPWVFFDIIKNVNPKVFLAIQIPILIINSFYTLIFVKDKYSREFSGKPSHPVKKKPKSTLSAVFFAEAAFYVVWAVMESKNGVPENFSITTIGTLVGIVLISWYSKTPHFSLISLFYAGCWIFVLSSFIPSISGLSLPFTSLFGGMYLPLVTYAMIFFYGGKHKAYAASLVEFIDSLSRVFGTILPLIVLHLGFSLSIKHTFGVMAVLFFIAMLIQRISVKDDD